MGCRGHFGPQAQFSGWNTALIKVGSNTIKNRLKRYLKHVKTPSKEEGAPNDCFLSNICSEKQILPRIIFRLKDG